VAVLTGIATAHDLAPHADVVLADISQLGQWIDALQPT
jgi:phosphoglycolate phosphatase